MVNTQLLNNILNNYNYDIAYYVIIENKKIMMKMSPLK